MISDPFSGTTVWLWVLAAAVMATGTVREGWAQAGSEVREVYAQYVEGAINIDGRLDEAAWDGVEPATGFQQFEPEEGAPSSYQTEVYLLYGENSLFVGAVMHDESGEAVTPALGRRDMLNRADWFIISLDSYFDRRTAYAFGINAAGVQFDGLRSEQGGPGGGPGGGGGGGPNQGFDESWDAVWYSDARVTSTGWVAEMRIPYSMLRFSEEERQTWGVHFSRRIPRLSEESEWPLIPRTERENLVAQFGLLQGISGVDPRRNIQVAPYTVSRLETHEHDTRPGDLSASTSVDVGGDLKVGLGTNVTLDATVNPDFGQVESDPAVLNLTAFETEFEERRPFFVEGGQIYSFSVGPGQLLYTRRIGAEAPIVGATKVSGRTANGLSFGVLGATVGDDFDPTRHFGVARATQQIGDFSSAGGILTGFSGPGAAGRRTSLAGGLDWDLRFASNQYGVEGFAAVTDRRFPVRDAQTGFAGKTWFRKRAGAWQGFIGLDVFSDEFNPNDIGRLNQNGFIAMLFSVEHDVLGGRSFGPFQRASIETFTVQQVGYDDGLSRGVEAQFGGRGMLRGFQEVEADLEIQNPFGGYDVYETRGLWPWAKPMALEFRSEFETDSRRNWTVQPEFGFMLQEGGGRGLQLGFRGEWSVGSRLALESTLEGEWERNLLAWSSNESFRRTAAGWMIGTLAAPPSALDPSQFVPIEDDAELDAILDSVAPVGDDTYFVPVFGERDTRSLDLTVRSTITFTPVLSLQIYSQLFLARGQFGEFQVLQDRDHLASFDAFPKRNDFALGSLQSNLVLRWEYRRGSSLYLVWTHGRNSDDFLNPLGPWDRSPYEQSIDDHLGDTFGVFPDNVFLVKLNYTFLY